MVDPDTNLVRRIAEGDQQAAAELMRLRLPRVMRVASRMLDDRSLAEDVAQDVFLKVWTHAGKWRPGAARFETWMVRVTMNLCLDRLRRRREVTVEHMPEFGDEGSDAAQRHDAMSARSRVRQAIAALPERQRAALLLAHFEEQSNPEIATILEVSVEAVESLLARARRSLKAELLAEREELLGQQT